MMSARNVVSMQAAVSTKVDPHAAGCEDAMNDAKVVDDVLRLGSRNGTREQ